MFVYSWGFSPAFCAAVGAFVAVRFRPVACCCVPAHVWQAWELFRATTYIIKAVGSQESKENRLNLAICNRGVMLHGISQQKREINRRVLLHVPQPSAVKNDG